MTKVTAQVLGALAALLVGAGLLWQRVRPPPCRGAVFIELRPPLVNAGTYRFHLELDQGLAPCEFEVPLPVRGAVDTGRCGIRIGLETRKQHDAMSIAGLIVGVAAKALLFRVSKDGERLYDARLSPRFSPYEISREEDRRFCGERALASPACLRGSSQCEPFAAICDGPEDCGEHRICCVSPEWAREYGVGAATECTSIGRCSARLARFACHKDPDCPEGTVCTDDSLAHQFRQSLRVCQPR